LTAFEGRFGEQHVALQCKKGGIATAASGEDQMRHCD
jgi:hypothetical protein